MPDRPGLRIAEPSFPEASGESSVTLILEAAWPGDARDRYVLRMAPPVSEVFLTHDLLMQYQMMEIMDRVPLILMSSFGWDPGHSIVNARRAGLHPKAILYKPFRLDQLLETVETILDVHADVSHV